MKTTFGNICESMTRWQHFALRGEKAMALMSFRMEENSTDMSNKEVYETIDFYIENYKKMLDESISKGA